MIRYLRIRNLAIIRELSLDLSPGFTVITGETGAGKSILVDSLALLLGERAGSDRLRSGENLGMVEALFDVSSRESLIMLLEKRGYSLEEGDLILRREIQPGGRGRAFIGSRLASLADLKEVGELLVDLHGQHEHQTLLRTAEHLPLLDRFCGNEKALELLGILHAEIVGLRSRLEALRRDGQEIARRVDVLKFQVQEIDSARVRPGEAESLRTERGRVRNLAKIRELALSALERLYEGEGAALPVLEGVLSSVRELARIDSGLEGPLERSEEARLALRELAEELREAGREREAGPARLEEIESRLALLDSLSRKYGAGESDILEFRERAGRDLEELTQPGTSAEDLEARLREAASEFSARSESLSRARRRGSRSLEKEVGAQLAELAMEGTDLQVEQTVAEDPDSPVLREGKGVACDASGWDRIQFLIRTNPGEPPRPLARIASGGELSRIMLAVHLVLRRDQDDTVRVFDEVDAGIGGRVAEAVGRKLRRLSEGGQILCVTHLPQIASMGDHHLAVSKKVRSGRTEVRAEALDRDGSVREVARMLGGERISEITLRHAAEMVVRGR